jgi:hypothetical protein
MVLPRKIPASAVAVKRIRILTSLLLMEQAFLASSAVFVVNNPESKAIWPFQKNVRAFSMIW